MPNRQSMEPNPNRSCCWTSCTAPLDPDDPELVRHDRYWGQNVTNGAQLCGQETVDEPSTTSPVTDAWAVLLDSSPSPDKFSHDGDNNSHLTAWLHGLQQAHRANPTLPMMAASIAAAGCTCVLFWIIYMRGRWSNSCGADILASVDVTVTYFRARDVRAWQLVQ